MNINEQLSQIARNTINRHGKIPQCGINNCVSVVNIAFDHLYVNKEIRVNQIRLIISYSSGVVNCFIRVEDSEVSEQNC